MSERGHQHQRHSFFTFGFGFPFGLFWAGRPWRFSFGFPDREGYRRMLEDYRRELEEELKRVEEELERLRRLGHDLHSDLNTPVDIAVDPERKIMFIPEVEAEQLRLLPL